jgi:hypothetical protein
MMATLRIWFACAEDMVMKIGFLFLKFREDDEVRRALI